MLYGWSLIGSVTPRFYKKRKWNFFEFSQDITNLSEVIIGNGINVI